jgi:diguanylate cyclase (GGDEF)-like protein
MPDKTTTTFDKADLLETLKGYSFLNEFRLALYCKVDDPKTPLDSGWRLCGAVDPIQVQDSVPLSPFDEIMNLTVASNRPTVQRSPVGLFSFAVPLPTCDDSPCCLVGQGVRDKRLDLNHLESLAKTGNIDPFTLLGHLEKLPVATKEEVEDAAEKTHRLLPSLRKEEPQDVFIEKTVERLDAVVGICAEIDKATAAELALSLFLDTITILFDVPRIGVALSSLNKGDLSLIRDRGLQVSLETIPTSRLESFIPKGRHGKCFALGDEIEELFPQSSAYKATCLPLCAGDERLGLVALFDVELQGGEASLLELLAARVAAKLEQLRRKEELCRANSLTEKMLEMVSTMALMEENEELYHGILEMAARLVLASCGSLMLIGKNGEDMQIESVLGMNLHLAKSLNLKVGNGIAGRVAASGRPLLVNDIENDTRISTRNRPRFKTKSFLSIPLKFKKLTLGVLNLSDKGNGEIFVEEDLDVITRFGNHAAAMIHRANALKRSEILEQLAVTDPLTELYNRRFLIRRMEEELNRSRRQNGHLTFMMIDLDNFKIYNDLCGHVAGDRALKKVGRILKSSVREMDVVARYGGEEFCVILPGTAKMESLFVAERIRRTIEKESFSGEEGLPLEHLTASIGISSFPEDGGSITPLINSADTALYQAKKAGRNRIVIFHEAANDTSSGLSSKIIKQQH